MRDADMRAISILSLVEHARQMTAPVAVDEAAVFAIITCSRVGVRGLDDDFGCGYRHGNVADVFTLCMGDGNDLVGTYGLRPRCTRLGASMPYCVSLTVPLLQMWSIRIRRRCSSSSRPSKIMTFFSLSSEGGIDHVFLHLQMNEVI